MYIIIILNYFYVILKFQTSRQDSNWNSNSISKRIFCERPPWAQAKLSKLRVSRDLGWGPTFLSYGPRRLAPNKIGPQFLSSYDLPAIPDVLRGLKKFYWFVWGRKLNGCQTLSYLIANLLSRYLSCLKFL